MMAPRKSTDASDQLIHNSIMVSFAMAILCVVLIVVSGVLGIAFGQTFFYWASISIVTGAALFIGALLLRGWENARWVLVEPVAAQIAKQNAEAAKTKAEAERILAEADAISGGANVINQNINTTATGKAKVAISAPVVQENIRLIPVNTPGGKLIEGLPAAAICFFIDQYDVRGWGQRAWVDCGMRIPGLSEPVDYDTWRQLVSVIEKVGGTPPVKERTKIKPVLDLQVIKSKALGPSVLSTKQTDETA